QGYFGQMLTISQEGAQAQVVLFGTLQHPRRSSSMNPPGDKKFDGGRTEFHVLRALKTVPPLGGKKVLDLPHYFPVADPRQPPPELLFGRIVDGKLVVDRMIRVRSAAATDYLADALALDASNRARALVYFFRFLEDAGPEVASDAFTRLIGADYQDL